VFVNEIFEDVEEDIYEICSSSVYSTLSLKTIAILTSYQAALANLLLGTGKTLNDLNGDLDGQYFKGEKIQ